MIAWDNVWADLDRYNNTNAAIMFRYMKLSNIWDEYVLCKPIQHNCFSQDEAIQ